MSDFVPKDLLPDLWDEILQRHWHFLETEEDKQKIEERKKLENCLKEFLCVVPHDRKFFLPETAQVLKQTIRDSDNFTALKAIAGFEAVSQYANNLFTKPWRKEFRILKTYSGFYQHEIKSNLVNAVKLFEAMGYRRLSDEILILDGPICPDQVTNVSRDAMAAYVECQIIKNIYSGLVTSGIKCSWQDIFHYREKFVGGTTQAIRELSYPMQERRRHKEKHFSNENSGYATIQHLGSGGVPAPPPPPIRSQCQSCAPYHLTYVPTSQIPCALHGTHNQMQTPCAVHPTKVSLMCNGSGNKMYTSYPTATGHCHSHIQMQSTPNNTAHMSHSRSLEHYNEPPPLVPHRHSFDHQQEGCSSHHKSPYQVPHSYTQYAAHHLYESPYDCIDAPGVIDDSMDGSSVSYAAVAASNTHTYNVSGNRYPLPYNISNQLNSHYSTPSAPTVTCNGVGGVYDTPYAASENLYATISKPTQHSCGFQSNQQSQRSPLPGTRLLNALTAKDSHSYRQGNFPPEQLIDFDDRAFLTTHDYNAHQHMQMQMQKSMERDSFYSKPIQRSVTSRRMNGLNPSYADPKDVLCQQPTNNSSDDAYTSQLYARPVPRSTRLKESQSTKQTTDKYLRKTDSIQGNHVDNNRKMTKELDERCLGVGENRNGYSIPRRKLSNQSTEREYSDLNYESAGLDEYVAAGHNEHPKRSPTQAVKIQDGVGSYESWNYVYQKLDRSGHTKDQSEDDDLLMQSLDLDSLNLGTASVGVSNSVAPNINPSLEKRRALETKSFENGNEKSKNLEKVTTTFLTSSDKRSGDVKPTKQTRTTSILKQPTTKVANSSTATTSGNKKTKSALKSATSTTTPTPTNMAHSKSNGSVRQTNAQGPTRSTNGKKIPVATQIIVSKPNEWNCRFCTFLNPDKERICEMCSHSKDFNLEATVSNTPTCV